MSLKPFLDRVRSGPVIADGAIGTLLIERGLESGGCPEALNLERPELLTEIAGLYLDAGAEIIQTNTFGASPLKLASYGLDGRTDEINAQAVAAVRSAVGYRAYVSGSVGPSGAILQPYGDTPPGEVRRSYARQMRALIEAGVDVITVETMIDHNEAALAIAAARELSFDLPVMATMTFDETPRGFFTIMGTDIPGAANGLLAAGADVVGSNCGNGSETMVAIAKAFRRATDAPLLIQPNAGAPSVVDGAVVYSETPELMAKRAREIVAAGADIVGGCCGSTPEHIRALRSVLLPGHAD
jgi:5-methyltetrahydrofolate--homocysteine methyltransferase